MNAKTSGEAVYVQTWISKRTAALCARQVRSGPNGGLRFQHNDKFVEVCIQSNLDLTKAIYKDYLYTKLVLETFYALYALKIILTY